MINLSEKEKEKFDRAKKRVDEIKGFYTHLAVYLVVNVVLLLSASGLFNGAFKGFHISTWYHFTTPIFWGIGLLFHGLFIFQIKSGSFKKWEERKIKEYMEKDKEESEKYNN